MSCITLLCRNDLTNLADDLRELRNALKHYGLDVSTQGAIDILAAYDDYPDGKLDESEFAELVRDLQAL